MNRRSMAKMTKYLLLGFLSLSSSWAYAQREVTNFGTFSLIDGFYNNVDKNVVLEVIDSAKETLDIEIYEMEDANVIAAVRRAMNERNVVVRVVKEPRPVGEKCQLFTEGFTSDDPRCQNELALKEEILQKGAGNYVAFNKKNLCGKGPTSCFMHGKMILADSKIALISTGNFNSTNLCNLSQKPSKCNRDFSVISTDSDAVALLQEVFANDLKESSYDLERMVNSQRTEKVTVSPLSMDPLVRFISSATKTLQIHNQYLKEAKFNQAIVEAAERGVKVDITLASLCAFAKPKPAAVKKATEAMGDLLTHPNVSVKMLPSSFQIQGKPGYMHAKAILVDDERAWIGSVNGSESALNNNREFGLFLTDLASVQSLDKVLTADHDSVKMETWEESAECKKDRAGRGRGDEEEE